MKQVRCDVCRNAQSCTFDRISLEKYRTHYDQLCQFKRSTVDSLVMIDKSL